MSIDMEFFRVDFAVGDVLEDEYNDIMKELKSATGEEQQGTDYAPKHMITNEETGHLMPQPTFSLYYRIEQDNVVEQLFFKYRLKYPKFQIAGTAKSVFSMRG